MHVGERAGVCACACVRAHVWAWVCASVWRGGGRVHINKTVVVHLLVGTRHEWGVKLESVNAANPDTVVTFVVASHLLACMS